MPTGRRRGIGRPRNAANLNCACLTTAPGPADDDGWRRGVGPAKSESESGCRAEAVAPARWIESSSVDRSSVESSQWRESKTSESASARLSHQVTSECSRLLHIFCILIAVNPSLQSLAVNPSLQSLRPPAADTAAPRRPTVTHRPVTVMGRHCRTEESSKHYNGIGLSDNPACA